MNIVSLSDSKWKLMNVLWEQAPCTITQLVTLMKNDTGWSKHTIISMLTRLENKGAVNYHTGERAKQFYPVIDRTEAQIEETNGFLTRLYGGSLGLLVNTMVQEKGLSKEEIDELYNILKKAEDQL